MKPKDAALGGCALLVIALLAACRGSSDNRPGTTVTTGARMLMNDDAAMRLTNARCLRESRCDIAGAARRFTSQEACTRELFPEAQSIVVPEACPLGVNEDRLSRCLDDIATAPCATPDAPRSCARAELCVAQ